jgi:hypothetical protein
MNNPAVHHCVKCSNFKGGSCPHYLRLNKPNIVLNCRHFKDTRLVEYA